MKLPTADNKFVSNIGDTSQFTIQASAKAFKILSSGIYSDSKLAIVRELSCNAYDAHVAAGCPNKPFDVILPTSLTPYFEVRDYGIGLSDEDVKDIYTTFFGSTKTESNDFVGALGLGSKSPFSYTDSFTVVSYFNGVASTYMAFVDESGNPSITRTSQVATDENNGLKVKVPVRSGDYYSFKIAATNAYMPFRVKPNFIGEGVYCDIDADYEVDIGLGRNVLVKEQKWSSRFYAIQGNVMYNISEKYLPAKADLISGVFYIEFPIGTVSFAASREELQYDEMNTSKKIHDAVLGVIDQYFVHFNNKLNENKTKLEAINYIRGFYASCKHNKGTIIDNFDLTWNGVCLSEFFYRNGFHPNLRGRMFYSAKDNRGTKSLKIANHGDDYFSFSTDAVILVDDESNFRRKVREYCLDNGVSFNNVILVRGEKIKTDSKEAWSRYLMGVNVIKTSELPELHHDYSRSRSVYKTPDAKVFDSRCMETDKELSDVKYYAEIYRWEVIGNNYSQSMIQEYANAKGIEVFFIKSKNIKRLPDDAVEIGSMIDNEAASENDIKIAVSDMVIAEFSQICECGLLDDYIVALKDKENMTSSERTIYDISIRNYDINNIRNKANEIIDQLYIDYPMLVMYNDLYHYSDKEKHKDLIMNYIKEKQNG